MIFVPQVTEGQLPPISSLGCATDRLLLHIWSFLNTSVDGNFYLNPCIDPEHFADCNLNLIKVVQTTAQG